MISRSIRSLYPVARKTRVGLCFSNSSAFSFSSSASFSCFSSSLFRFFSSTASPFRAASESHADDPAYPGHLSVRIFKDKSAVSDSLLRLLSNRFPKLNAKEWRDSSSFTEIGLDSLDVMEAMVLVETHFECDIPDEKIDKMNKVGDLVEYILWHPRAKLKAEGVA